MNQFVWKVCSGTFVLLVLLALPASAQISTAQLSGKVTDTSNAVLPGATVTLTQTDTGAVRSVVSDADGSYLVSNLSPGPYRLEIALQGFRTYVQTGIVLQVAATPTINVSLALGDVQETITVQAEAPLVDVKSAGVSEVVESQRIVELPLQGRDVTSLLVLAGASVNTGSPNSRSFAGGANVAVAGGLPFGVAYLLDGAMHNDSQNNANLPLPFSRRAAGIPCRDHRTDGTERHAFGRVRERDHQVGHEPVLGQSIRVQPGPPVQRHRSVCKGRQRQAG